LASLVALSPLQAAVVEPAVSYTTGIGAVALGNFYDARGGTPIWLTAGQHEPGARLLDILEHSDLDGLDPQSFDLDELSRAMHAAESGRRTDVARADRMLSEAFLRYVADLRRVGPSSEWQFVDREAAPAAPSVSALLREAAATGSLDDFLTMMPWMHESYAGLRRAVAEAEAGGDGVAAARLRLNLERVRLLPAGGDRYVLVNTAAQRLYMYEGGKVVDTMRVVVGKPAQPTPMLAAMIRYTAINPYWNVPEDLVGERVAPSVIKLGLPYLREKGYVVLSTWEDDATPIDPATVDWQAVAAGTTRIRVRQEPGSANAMGQMKFMFPNQQGVYLHDTPQKELLAGDVRMHSAGCVRLEDAPRLARWLYGRALDVPKGGKPEEHVDLDKPVPVYLAYLTAFPEGSETVFYDDVYGRDRARLAALESARVATR
jgi:murein L,D-transpeptidase YcbB/YkuD